MGDGTAIDVGLCWVEAQFILNGDGLCSECLVRFDEIDIIQAKTGLVQCLWYRSNGSDAHAGWIHAGNGPRDNLGEGIEAAL